MMESLAFLYHAVAYEEFDPILEWSPCPDSRRSPHRIRWRLPNALWMRLTGLAVFLLLLSIQAIATAQLYQRGSQGDDVTEIQQVLNITADGIFGPETEAAVVDYQQRLGLQVDGIVGPETLGAMGLEPLSEAAADPTPYQAIVSTPSGIGVNVRRSPFGMIDRGLPEGASVSLTGREQSVGGYDWAETTEGQWIAIAFLVPQTTASVPSTPPTSHSILAVVDTPSNIGLNVRRTPYGVIESGLPDGAEVALTGREEAVGEYLWAETTYQQWVAKDFLIVVQAPQPTVPVQDDDSTSQDPRPDNSGNPGSESGADQEGAGQDTGQGSGQESGSGSGNGSGSGSGSGVGTPSPSTDEETANGDTDDSGSETPDASDNDSENDETDSNSESDSENDANNDDAEDETDEETANNDDDTNNDFISVGMTLKALTQFFTGPQGLFEVATATDQLDAPNGTMISNLEAGTRLEITERRSLANGTIWAEVDDGSWVDIQAIALIEETSDTESDNETTN